MIIPPIRKPDVWGSGEYGARRVRGGIVYPHEGVDLAAYPDSAVLAHTRMTVKRIGLPSSDPKKNGLRLIECEVDAQTRVKFMYVFPTVRVGQRLKTGDRLGIVQDLNPFYEGITNHYHLEVIIEGVKINPRPWLEYIGYRI